MLPPEAAVHSAPGIDRSTVRIHSDQKLPERVVYDTTLPTIVPASKVQTAAAPAPVPAPDMSAQTRVRNTFAQFIPGEPRKAEQKAEQGVVSRTDEAAKVEPVAPPKKRKIARVHSAPPVCLSALRLADAGGAAATATAVRLLRRPDLEQHLVSPVRYRGSFGILSANPL